METIVAALGGGAATDKIWGEGVHIIGEKYVVTKAEDRSIYGRKVRFIIATYPSNLQPGALPMKF
jgi:profilin